jgi:superfamily II DNA/RNA helicase
LGHDSVVVASTGAGKTMPFMMPLMLNKSKKVIIVLLLKILQVDQVQDILILIWGNSFLQVK